MNNAEFLNIIKESFSNYLSVDTSRSTKKLKTLHGHIAEDIKNILGPDFEVSSQGYENDKEKEIDGRYYAKKVDITISQNNKAIAGYSIKFVMRNYSQNSNNYFENMLGETANLRCNAIPYFQIFIIFDKVPYFENGGKFKKYDKITKHNIDKYLCLSKDDPALFYHTPDKTLFILIRLKEKENNYQFTSSSDYSNYYNSVIADTSLMEYSNNIEDLFDNRVIYNNYENFINRTNHIILGKLK